MSAIACADMNIQVLGIWIDPISIRSFAFIMRVFSLSNLIYHSDEYIECDVMQTIGAIRTTWYAQTIPFKRMVNV